jgi:hypothetical protein
VATAPMIVFDFINKAVITAGVDSEADRKVQDFLKQQTAQSATPPRGPDKK